MGEADYFRYCRSIRLDLLNLYGRRYVIDHVIAELQSEMEDKRYKAYITDALMVMTENTAKFAGGRHLTVRWADKFKPQDTRTGEEIVEDVVRNAGLTIKGGDG